MKHIVLLGDSIFDNATYVSGGPDVIRQLHSQLPEGWKATLKAIDGSVIDCVRKQLSELPLDVTHLVISVGGNDALNHASMLEEKAHSVADTLNRLADVAEIFQFHYQKMLRSALSLNLPTVICTIYYPRFPDRVIQRIAVAALTIFNDVIIKEAFKAGIPLIDLRLVCNEDADYSNPIEPSIAGGKKIAEVIIKTIREHRFESRRTEVFV